MPDDTCILPTHENRLTAYLCANGIDLSPGDYLVRQARCVRWLAGLNLDAETLAARLAFVDQHPQLLLAEEWGPAPFVEVDWSLVFPCPAKEEHGSLDADS